MKTIRRLVSYTKPYSGYVIFGFLAMIIVSAMQLLYPYIVQILFDNVLTENPKRFYYLNLVLFSAAGIILVKGVFTFGQTYLMSFLGQRVVADLRREIYQHLQKMSLAYHESRRVGDTIARVTNDVSLIQTSVSVSMIDIIYQSIILISTLTIILVKHWKLASLTLITFPLIFWVVSYAGTLIKRFSHRAQEKVADLTSILQETLIGIRVVKAFVREKEEIRRFNQATEASFKSNMRSVKIMSLLTPIVEILFVSGLLLVIWYSSMEVAQGHMSQGELVAFFGYIGLGIAPLTSITHNFNLIQQALAGTERVFNLLDQKPDLQDAPEAITLPELKGEVQFKQVEFSYRPGEAVLTNLNLVVEPGEIIALVGPSGSGKTSFINLLMRFYDPNSGQILVDGYDLKKVKISSLRRQIGFVPQESILFGTTIRENIAYGKPEATMEEIVKVAQMANAHNFISDLPEQYETLIGERGVALSGGQRQRLAIARALLGNPQILILDEATSALDNESELLVQEALERLMKNRTTFIIAHRLSTIKQAHKIVVLEGGEIVESGNHQALIARDGLYKKLYEIGTSKNLSSTKESRSPEEDMVYG